MKTFASSVIALIIGVIIGMIIRPETIRIVHTPVEKEVIKEVEKEVVKVVVQEKEVIREVEKQCSYPIYVTIYEHPVINRERIYLTGGYGPRGVNVKDGTEDILVSQNKGFVFGVGYQHKISPELSLGVEILNNNTYLGQIGFDF